MTDLLKEIKEKRVETLKLADVQPEEIGDDEPLFGEGLGLDSIDGFEMVVMLERDYGVKIGSKVLGHPNSSPTDLLPPQSNNFIDPQWKNRRHCAPGPLYRRKTRGGNSFPVSPNPPFKSPRRPLFYPLQTVPYCLN